jgi:hypothetical protein
MIRLNNNINIKLLAYLFWLSPLVVLHAQSIALPTKPTPKPVVKPSPVVIPKPQPVTPAPVKNYPQVEVALKLDVSAKLIIRTDVEGKTITQDIVFTTDDVGNFRSELLYVGSAQIEIKLANGKTYMQMEYLSIPKDLRIMEVFFNNGNIVVNKKTQSQIMEESKRQREQELLSLVNSLDLCVADLRTKSLPTYTFENSIIKLYEKDFIPKSNYDAAIGISGRITAVQNSLPKVESKIKDIAFFKYETNFMLVSLARTDLKALKSQYEILKKSWSLKEDGVIYKISMYIDHAESILNQFPASQEEFNKKVSQVLRDIEAIKLEEERKEKLRIEEEASRQRVIQERLERERLKKLADERQAKLNREREEAEQQAIYDDWSSKSGVFLAGSTPIGIEIGVLSSDRVGNMWGFRYSAANQIDSMKLLFHNSFTFPIVGPIQMGITLGLGTQKSAQKNSEGDPMWNFDFGIGGRLMYVDHYIMLGAEYIYGMNNGMAGGLFFLGGIKIGGL